jgi:hypothetical protein
LSGLIFGILLGSLEFTPLFEILVLVIYYAWPETRIRHSKDDRQRRRPLRRLDGYCRHSHVLCILISMRGMLRDVTSLALAQHGVRLDWFCCVPASGVVL